MDYEREMFEMGGNPLKDDLLKYGIITEEDILKAGILRDMEKAKEWLNSAAPELLERYEELFPVSEDFGAHSRHDLDDLAAVMQDIEAISSRIYENFRNLDSRSFDLDEYFQKRVEAA